MRASTLLALASAAQCVLTATAQQPEQVHLSLTGKPGEMAVEFVSHAAPGANFVFWSTSVFSPDDAFTALALPPAPGANALSLPGFIYKAGFLEAGSDLMSAVLTVEAAGAWCSANSSCQGFTFNDPSPSCSTNTCNMYFKTADAFAPSAAWQTYVKPGPAVNSSTTTWFPYLNSTLGPIGYMHTGLMSGLEANTTYYYVVGNDTGGWSAMGSFINEPLDRPTVYAVLADFGLYNGESLVKLYTDASQRAFDVVIHAGDFAYDFDSQGGEVGNEFMRAMSGYAASYPVMPSVGNHESHFNFSQYGARFAGVAAHAGVNSGSGTNLYYSFDVGLVHWVTFSTEVYWASPGAVEPQLAWLKQDLARANANRAAVPWIVAFAHKAAYMDTTYCNSTSCYANGTWFEDILQEAGVDFYAVGHMHEYRRFVPNYFSLNLTDNGSVSADMHTYTDPQYLITLVTGSPGNQEVQPPSCGGPTPNDPTFPTAACSRNYGYGYLQVLNSSTAVWEWVTSVPIAGSPDPEYTDKLWVVQNNHGPRTALRK